MTFNFIRLLILMPLIIIYGLWSKKTIEKYIHASSAGRRERVSNTPEEEDGESSSNGDKDNTDSGSFL